MPLPLPLLLPTCLRPKTAQTEELPTRTLSLRVGGMVEKAGAVAARKLDVSSSAGRCSPWQQQPEYCGGGLPSPTSPLDRPAPSPRGGGWRHRDAGGVGLGILLAALEAREEEQVPAAASAAPRVSAVAIASPTRRCAARLEVSELGCSGLCATSLCGSGSGAASFLACCDLCRRPLDGKDIFMYRGERAFCSMECRYHAIVSDEFQEEKDRKRRAAAPRDIPSKVAASTTAAAEIAGSPCSGGGQIFFTTGIVAA